MKKTLQFLCILMLVAGLAGCANPFKAWNKATNKVATAQVQLDKNEDNTVNQAKNYIYATKVVLSADPSTNRFHELETTFNDKALLTLGPPTMQDAVILQKMVENLLSTNKALVAAGNKMAATYDSQVVTLQNENALLLNQIEVAHKKVEQVGENNASMALKWHNLISYLWWAVYIVIGFTVVRIVTAVLPPPYNSLGIIVSLPVSIISKMIHMLVPDAQKLAGLVSEDYQKTTSQLIEALQTLKNQHPELHNEISATVANSVDSTLSKTLNQAKADLKIIS